MDGCSSVANSMKIPRASSNCARTFAKTTFHSSALKGVLSECSGRKIAATRVSVTERASYIGRVRTLAKGCCEAWVAGEVA